MNKFLYWCHGQSAGALSLLVALIEQAACCASCVLRSFIRIVKLFGIDLVQVVISEKDAGAGAALTCSLVFFTYNICGNWQACHIFVQGSVANPVRAGLGGFPLERCSASSLPCLSSYWLWVHA